MSLYFLHSNVTMQKMCDHDHSEQATLTSTNKLEAWAESRRGFMKWFAGAVLLLATFPSALAHAKKVAFPIKDALATPGGSAMLKIKDRDVLFVRKDESSIVAINPECTHKKCKVRFVSDSGDFHCKCHKSAFTLEGKVMGGPAKIDLEVYEAKIDGDRIILTLPD